MLTLDATTLAEYNAASTAAARAQVIVDALVAPVYVRIYDQTGTQRASGTMGSPWATRSGSVLTAGPVGASNVSNGGTPGAGWYLQFESGSRYLRGSFGLSGTDFTWSLPTFATGTMIRIGTVTATAVAGGVTFGWIDEAEVKSVNVVTGGTGYGTAQDAVIPGGVTPTYAIVPAVTGMAINPTTGVLTSSIDRTATSVTVEIWDGSTESNALAGAAIGRATATGNLSGGGIIGTTDLVTVIPLDTQSLPAVLGTVTFSAYGNTVVQRINSCADAAHASPTTLISLVPEYSQLPAFNSDSTMLILERIKPGDGDGYLFCDAVSPFTVRKDKHSKAEWYPAFVTNLRWSPKLSEPYVLYAVGNDCAGLTWDTGLPTAHNNAVILRLTINPTTGVVTPLVIGSFNHFRRLGAAAGWADAREDVTEDANGHVWMACVGQRVADLEPFYVLHNCTTNTTYAGASADNADPWRQLNANTTIGMVNVNRTPDSVYPVPDGTGFMAYNGEGLWKWNRTCTAGRNVVDPGKADHGDICFDASGAAWWVYAGSNSGRIRAGKIDGDTPAYKDMLNYNYVNGLHISGRNTLAKTKGIAVISFDEETATPSNARFRQEILLLDMESVYTTPIGRRLCQHRADMCTVDGTNDYYRGQSHATINRQGTKIVFGSNWGDQSNTVADTFLIENVP